MWAGFHLLGIVQTLGEFEAYSKACLDIYELIWECVINPLYKHMGNNYRLAPLQIETQMRFSDSDA
jgi:hypothetical protein